MNLKMEDFLRAVLPDEGHYIAYIVAGENKYNSFAATIEELAQIIRSADQAGYTVYHACASFRVAQNDKRDTPRNQRRLGRTHYNVLAAKAFWLDVDTGAGKPFPDPAAGAEAVFYFCKRLLLPPPICVGSGTGLHVYWPLEKPLLPETWQVYAEGLKVCCAQYGLHADRVRTSDVSSVLRTPGSHNRKHGEKLVECGPLVGPYALSQFEFFKNAAPLQKSSKVLQRPSLIASALKLNYPNEPVYVENIISSCPQIASIKKTPDQASEPVWHACLGVFAFCEDGLETAKSWSSPEWYSQIEEKTERQKEFGPTTCAKFEDVNPQGCEGCPFRGTITSPIQLSRRTNDSSSSPRPPVDTVQLDRKNSEVLQELPSLNPPFAWENNALVFKTEVKGVLASTNISSCPLYLKGVQTGEIQQDRFSLMFMLKLPNEDWKQLLIPAGEFFSSSGMSALAARGAVIHEHDLFRQYVRQAIDRWNMDNRLQVRYDQFGWKDEETAFVYGSNLYRAEGVTPIMGSQELRQRSQWLTSKRGGSLERWSAAANSLFAAGCEPQSLALLASFAAPLMRFHSTEEGGAIISLVSQDSGSGKTTALAAAASVWGQEKGLSLTNIDTKVSKGLTLGVLGNLPVVYDELTNKDPSIIKEFVFVFTNGRDKMRGTTEGEIRHTQASWQTILISGSNMSLVDLLSSHGANAPAFRVLEFNTKLPPNVHRKGDSLKKELQSNHGYAGQAYLSYLLQPEVLRFVKEALPKWTEQIWQKTGLSSPHRFWVRTLGSIAVAGAIVKKLGLVSFDPERIVEWGMNEIMERKDDASSTTSFSGPSMVSILSEFLNDNVASMLIMPGPYHPKTRQQPLHHPIHKLLIRYEFSTGRILITENAFKAWLQKREINSRELIQALKRMMVVTRPRVSSTLGAGTDLASGQIHCIEINGQHPALTGILAPINDVSEKVQDLRDHVAEVVPLRGASSPKGGVSR